MKILALDTSCMMGSVALLEDEKVIAEQLLNVEVTHSERLIPSIRSILKDAKMKLADVDVYAVAIGPGSFTGLRIGLAAAKAMAFAMDKPIIGISTLKALAYNLSSSEIPVLSLLDARRGQFYASIGKFNGSEYNYILEDTVLSPEDLLDHLRKISGRVAVVGDGVEKLQTITGPELKDKLVIPPPSTLHPRASNTGWLALKRAEADDFDDLALLVPNYIRKSDAEKNL